MPPGYPTRMFFNIRAAAVCCWMRYRPYSYSYEYSFCTVCCRMFPFYSTIVLKVCCQYKCLVKRNLFYPETKGTRSIGTSTLTVVLALLVHLIVIPVIL